MDVSSAYVHALLKELVYVQLPAGMGQDMKWKLLQLHKALYGLKQAGQAWPIHFANIMRDIGFKSCASEPCVFVQNTGKSVTLVVTYVDDLLVMGPDMGEIEVVKKQLKSQLNIRDLGSATEFLGLLVHQGHEGIHVRQSSSACHIVKKYLPNGHHCQLWPMHMDKNGGVLVGAKGKDQHVEGIGLD